MEEGALGSGNIIILAIIIWCIRISVLYTQGWLIWRMQSLPKKDISIEICIRKEQLEILCRNSGPSYMHVVTILINADT